MTFAKKISDHVPVLDDQGIDYVTAAGKAGVGLQGVTIAMPAGGVVTFAGLGLVDMADTTYQAHITNNTTAGAGKATSKAVTGFTIVGPTTNDALDISIVGKLKTQVS